MIFLTGCFITSLVDLITHTKMSTITTYPMSTTFHGHKSIYWKFEERGMNFDEKFDYRVGDGDMMIIGEIAFMNYKSSFKSRPFEYFFFAEMEKINIDLKNEAGLTQVSTEDLQEELDRRWSNFKKDDITNFLKKAKEYKKCIKKLIEFKM